MCTKLDQNWSLTKVLLFAKSTFIDLTYVHLKTTFL